MLILTWLIVGAVIGILAAHKRRFSTWAGLFGGLLLGPFAVLIFLVSSVTSERRCPHCAENVRREAIVCKHCHRDIVATFTKTALSL